MRKILTEIEGIEPEDIILDDELDEELTLV